MVPCLYEKELAHVDNKITEFCQKTGLKKPKLKMYKYPTPPACANARRNEIAISKNLLERWHNGDIGEPEINYTLAHEFGHLLDHRQKSRFQKLLNFNTFPIYLVALIAPVMLVVFLYGSISIIQNFAPITILLSLGYFLVWLLFLPGVLRRNIPSELAADRYAISYSLIEGKAVADYLARLLRTRRHKKIGLLHRAEIELNLASHPSIHEQLYNVDFEIAEIITKKINR